MGERTCSCGQPAVNAKGVPRCAVCKREVRRAYHREYERRKRRKLKDHRGRPARGDVVTAECRWCEREFSYVSLGRPRFKCDECKKRSGAALRAAWAREHPDRLREFKSRYNASRHGKAAAVAYYKQYRFRKYGVDEAWFEATLRAQGDRCAICRTSEPGGRHGVWHIDHDGTCCQVHPFCGNCVRGILCANCNNGIGMLGHDPERLLSAAAYLRGKESDDYPKAAQQAG